MSVLFRVATPAALCACRSDEATELSPVRDSGGSLPPGVVQVRESLNSTGEIPTAALLQGDVQARPRPASPHSAQDLLPSTDGASEGDTRLSDRMDVDLMRYLGTSMNTTTGTAASDDFTRTGLLSTNQLIQVSPTKPFYRTLCSQS